MEDNLKQLANRSVGHSKVNLSWDEERANPVLEKLYKNKNQVLDEEDIHNLIATDSESDEDLLGEKEENQESNRLESEESQERNDPFKSFNDKKNKNSGGIKITFDQGFGKKHAIESDSEDEDGGIKGKSLKKQSKFDKFKKER
jgi:hypothetical protein